MPNNARGMFLPLVFLAAASVCACQSPTSTSTTTLKVDDFVDSAVTPEPANADASSGKTYRVVRGNNQPDDILEYDWRTSFTITLTLNNNSTSKDVDLAFPVTVTAATAKVQQATGGIVTPPSSGEIEHYESLITGTSSNKFAAANTSVIMSFDVWYDLPNLRKEALITVTVSFLDDDGNTFSKNVTVRVNP